jgi:ADP-ribose pyrophosphatase
MSDLETLAAGRFLTLVRKSGWEYATRRGATGVVGLVAVTRDGRLVLTEQFRIPVGRPVIELPAGLAGDVEGEERESLATAARRELLEETGYEAGRLEFLFEGPSSAGLTDEVISIFLAADLVKTGKGGGDATETIVVHEVPVAELLEWLAAKIKGGAMIDPKVYSALYFAHRTVGGVQS